MQFFIVGFTSMNKANKHTKKYAIQNKSICYTDCSVSEGGGGPPIPFGKIKIQNNQWFISSL